MEPSIDATTSTLVDRAKIVIIDGPCGPRIWTWEGGPNEDSHETVRSDGRLDRALAHTVASICAAMADAEVIRMVKIKTGTVKRLQKVWKRDVEIATREQGRPDELTTRAWNVRTVSQDLNLYKKEFEEQQNKVDRMKEEGCDEHDIKQQV